MIKVIGYANSSSFTNLKPHEFKRHSPKDNEVLIDIKFCGVCHSDIHQARNEWKNTIYPCMPGHEIIGVVEKVGSKVTKFKEGSVVGVGCMIGSCRECENCLKGEENYCTKGATATYNGNQRFPNKTNHTLGGYSSKIVVPEDFVLKIPKSIPMESAGPILCAGITTYSPLKHWKVGPGTKVGVIGFGGLGHMAIKLATAMGAEVTVISTSKDKKRDAKKLGAVKFIDETDKKAMDKNKSTLDFILSTIPESHDVNPFFDLLKTDGVLTIVGCLMPLKKPLEMGKLIMDRKSLGSSVIGGIKETQEVLNFCAKHKIYPDIKLINIEEINETFDLIKKREADFRYVIDMSSLDGVHEKTFAEMLWKREV